MYECFELALQDKWALVTLARPERLNAIDEKFLLELEKILNFLETEGSKAVILTGEGKAFAAGADVGAMADLDQAGAEQFSLLGHGVFDKIEEHPAVFIAAVNGYALGGGLELALACDLRYASAKAQFGQPELNLGIIPGFGGTQRLAGIIGKARAKEWILTGKRFSAQDAFQAGLVLDIYEPDQLLPQTQACAEELAKKSGPILALAKQALGRTRPETNPEPALFAKCFATEDGPEGLRAFVEKRAPNFQDR